jgi:AcrR family transcriptional regulator
MTTQKRPYRKLRRAEAEAQTRLRITESAMGLHGSVGPAKTSIGAIAKHAGVRRSTVYRHFPDEASLFAACSSHWAQMNPMPDRARWVEITDPGLRLGAALGDLYGFYRRTAPMLENVLRDEPLVPVLTPLIGAYRAYLAAAREALTPGWTGGGRPRPRLAAALGHALAFSTWHSLVCDQGLAEAAAIALMVDLARLAATEAATAPPARGPRRGAGLPHNGSDEP